MASVEQVSQPSLRKLLCLSTPALVHERARAVAVPLSAPIDPAVAQGQVAGGQGHSTT
jgi:hypothetical protein